MPKVEKAKGQKLTLATEKQMRDFRREASLNGLDYFERELKAHAWLPKTEFAAQLGRSVKWVEKKHAEGALYGRSLSKDYVEEVRAAFPKIKFEERLPVVMDFVKQGHELLYPAWQIRKKHVIRPEVALARKAFALYAQEIFEEIQEQYKQKSDGQSAPPQLDPPVDDRQLFSFFNLSNGGMGNGSIADQIVKQDKARPKKPMTIEKFKDAWWYHINPHGDFS
jgi:hypothetical protein